MKSRIALAATLAFPLLVVGPAAASPISYAFTGTLYRPLNGSTQFDGTVTFESDPTLAPVQATSSWAIVSEYAETILNVGGHTFEFSSQHPNNDGNLLYAGTSPTWRDNTNEPRQDEIMILGTTALNPPASGRVRFGIMSYTPSSSQDLSDLRTLNFNLNTMSFYLDYHGDGESYQYYGDITSFTPIETPEPGAWMIALLAGGAAALRLRRRA